MDKRFGLVRHLNLPYDVSYIKDRYTRPEDWLARATELREQVLGAAGLLPIPEKCPLNPRIYGRIERTGYSVEKVYFESLPGFYVTGNLYRPLGKGPFPGVLNTHGHWKTGRMESDDRASIPGRCINLALQGYVAFSYDMIGFNDSLQFPHKFGGRLERLWGLTPGGLQLWNSIRALDFMQSLPDVDGSRIACTGASGGGTQTFLLCAVDDRVKVSAPVNMISAHMQGGCQCENLPNLRIDTDNVEIAALMAPRPMLMVSATGDWTKNTPDVEFPAVQHIYRLLGAEEKVSWVQIDAEHNYNKASREAVYSWFARWLPEEPQSKHVQEQPFKVEQECDLRLFADDKLPAGWPDAEALTRQWKQASEEQFKSYADSLYPDDPEAMKRFAAAYRPALAKALALPAALDLEAETLSVETDVDIATKRVLIRDKARGAEIPAVVVEPTDSVPAQTALIVDGPGGSLMESGGIRQLVASGWRVIGIDCFGIGANAAPEGAPERNFDKEFFDTYNRTDTQERVYDIVVTARWASRDVDRLALVGSGMGGPWCLLAAPFAQGVTDVAVDACELDLNDDNALLGELYVPCLRRVGDLRAAAVLCPPRRLMIHNTSRAFTWAGWIPQAYLAAGCEAKAEEHEAHVDSQHIAEWLQQA